MNDGTLIATYSGRRNGAGDFTDSSGVFVSTTQGSSWSDVSDPGMKYWTMDIVIDPNDVTQNTWYVCVFSGWGGAANNLGGIYRSINRGGEWTKIANTENINAGGLSSVFSLTFDPANKGAAYVNSEGEGLWYCKNIEATTPTFTLVQAYPFEQPNRVYFNPYNFNELWVNSFGNGIEMGTLKSTGTGINNLNNISSKVEALLIYPNPNDGQFTLKFDNPTNEPVQISIKDITGKTVIESTSSQQTYLYNANSIQAGVYVITVQGENIYYHGKMIVK